MCLSLPKMPSWQVARRPGTTYQLKREYRTGLTSFVVTYGYDPAVPPENAILAVGSKPGALGRVPCDGFGTDSAIAIAPMSGNNVEMERLPPLLADSARIESRAFGGEKQRTSSARIAVMQADQDGQR